MKKNNHSILKKLAGKKGFSLLELLVVISIIGILIAMGSVSYTTAQKKGRDSRRKGDMKAIQNAMEECYAVNDGAYPVIDLTSSTSISCGSETPMSSIPSDPKGGDCEYTGTSTADGYTFYADLEETGGCDGGNELSISNLQ